MRGKCKQERDQRRIVFENVDMTDANFVSSSLLSEEENELVDIPQTCNRYTPETCRCIDGNCLSCVTCFLMIQ